jgi:hypothetical protein
MECSQLLQENAVLRRDLQAAYTRLAAASEVLGRAAERIGIDLPLLAEVLEGLRAENAALRTELELARQAARGHGL